MRGNRLKSRISFGEAWLKMNEFRNARKRLLAIIFEQEELYNMGYEKIAVWWFFEQMFFGPEAVRNRRYPKLVFPRDLGSHKREWRFMQTCFPQLVSSERAKFNHWARGFVYENENTDEYLVVAPHRLLLSNCFRDRVIEYYGLVKDRTEFVSQPGLDAGELHYFEGGSLGWLGGAEVLVVQEIAGVVETI